LAAYLANPDDVLSCEEEKGRAIANLNMGP
jgi:hypothetical protein